jgi:hypothetical protein
MNDTLEVAVAVSAVIAAIAAAISAGVSWDSHNKAAESARESKDAALQANETRLTANDLRNEANLLRVEANKTATEALEDSRFATQIAMKALDELTKSNDHRETLAAAARLTAEIEAKRLQKEQAARVELRTDKTSTTTDGLDVHLRAKNLGPQPAGNFVLTMYRNREQFGNPTPPRMLEVGAVTGYQFSPRFGDFRSAIEGDCYRLAATFDDGNGPQNENLCFEFEGVGSADRDAVPALKIVDTCPDLTS